MTNLIINTDDSQQEGLIPDFTSVAVGSFQEFYNQDKSLDVFIRPVFPSTDAAFPWIADYDASDIFYFQIGEADAKATSGTFTLTYNGSTTSALSHSINENQLKTAIEGLGTGDVTVSLLSEGIYQVQWDNTGVVSYPFTSDADLLLPACEIIVTVTNVGSVSEREQRVIEIRQAPVVSSTIDTVFTPTGVSVSQKSANSGTQNAIYEINLGDAYAGEYTVSVVANGVTNIVVLDASMEPDAIGVALAAHPEIYYQDTSEPDNVAVSKSGSLVTIQFVGTLGGTSSVRTITANTLANPTVITSANHKLKTGDSVVISGSNSTPTIDGTRTVTVVDANTFTVPVNVTTAGTSGSFYATSQPSVAYGTDLSLISPQGFTGTIDFNTVALAKQFWATTEDEITLPVQIKRVRSSGEERTIYGSTVNLKKQLVNGSLVIPSTSGTIVVLAGKTFTVNNTLTVAGTDGTTMTFPATSSTLARTSGANTFTGSQTFTSAIEAQNGINTGNETTVGVLALFAGTGTGDYTVMNSVATGSRTVVFPDNDGTVLVLPSLTNAYLYAAITDLYVDQTVSIFDEDFLGGTNTDGQAGSNGIRYGSISGTNSIAFSAGTANNPGILQISTGASSGNAGSLYYGGSALSTYSIGSNYWELRITFKLSQTTATKLRIGMANDYSAVTPGRGEYLRYDTSAGDTNFMFVVKDGGAETATSSGVAVDTNWHTLRIRTITPGSYIYGMSLNTSGGSFSSEVQVTNTNSVAGITRYIAAIIGNDAVAAAKTLQLDAIKMRWKCTR